jgi:putative endonuclease
MNKRNRGNKGETKAAAYLESCGCIILVRNHYARGGEVDIIFREADRIVFCEVKARGQSKFGTGAEAVNWTKQKRICKAALDWASSNKNIDEKFRFDIIEVDNGKINHIKDAFEFIEP